MQKQKEKMQDRVEREQILQNIRDYELSVIKQKEEEKLKKVYIKNMMQRNREQSKLEKEKETLLD